MDVTTTSIRNDIPILISILYITKKSKNSHNSK